MTLPQFLTVQGACRLIGGDRPISAATYYRAAARGAYPKPVKVGANVARIDRDELLAALRARGLNVECLEPACAETEPTKATAASETAVRSLETQTSDVEAMLAPLERRPSHVTGVYFLYCDDTLLYVGGSSNCIFRIGQHVNEGRIPFNGYAVLACALRKIAEVEERYIRHFRPPYNTAEASGFSPRVTVGVGELRKW